MKRISLVALLLLTIGAVPSWAERTKNFHFMPFVLQSLKIKDYDQITIQEDKLRSVKFTYDGKSYEGQAFTSGMLYMKGNGREWVINFDFTAYRRPTFINPWPLDLKF